MKTIQLKVEDSGLDVFLSIINNLRSGIIRDYTVRDDSSTFGEEISDDENEYYVNLLNNMSAEDREVASREFVTI